MGWRGRSGARAVIVGSLTALVALGALAAARPAHAALTVADSGAWSWFGDPRAVFYAGAHRRTYVGWVDAQGDTRIASYDHDSRTVSQAAIANAGQVDDHDTPSLYVRPDGRLVAFWSAHSGAQLWYRVSTSPEDVSAWDPTRQLGTNTPGRNGYTYPNPIRQRDGLYLFWRGGNWQPSFSVSPDEGATWSPAQTLIQGPAGQRPYVKYERANDDTVVFAFTNAHPDSVATGIYYATLRGGAFYRADGTKIHDLAAGPLTPDQADVVYAPGPSGPHAWIHDVALDAAGNPVITYATLFSATDHHYHYARWTGAAWEDHDLGPAGGSFDEGAHQPQVSPQPSYSGGIVLDHTDPSSVLLSKKVGATFAVERDRTPDGGATWSSVGLTSPSSVNDVRPVVPRGASVDSDLGAFWMHGTYPDYQHFATGILAQASADWTGPPPPPPPPPTPAPPVAPVVPVGPSAPARPKLQPRRASAAVVTTRAGVDRRGILRLRLSCPAGCRGVLVLARGRVTLAVRAVHREGVQILRLSPRGRRLIRARGRVAVSVRLTGDDAARVPLRLARRVALLGIPTRRAGR